MLKAALTPREPSPEEVAIFEQLKASLKKRPSRDRSRAIQKMRRRSDCSTLSVMLPRMWTSSKCGGRLMRCRRRCLKAIAASSFAATRSGSTMRIAHVPIWRPWRGWRFAVRFPMPKWRDYTALVARARASGLSFEQAMRVGVEAILVSPNFLYRIERDPNPNDLTAHPVNDFELASRLSYFLWSSMPDEELLRACRRTRAAPAGRSARAGAAHASGSEGRSAGGEFRRAVAGAAEPGQHHSPIRTSFPQFDNQLRQAMRTETEMFFTLDCARRSEHSGFHRWQIYVSERAAGEILRHSRRRRARNSAAWTSTARSGAAC